MSAPRKFNGCDWCSPPGYCRMANSFEIANVKIPDKIAKYDEQAVKRHLSQLALPSIIRGVESTPVMSPGRVNGRGCPIAINISPDPMIVIDDNLYNGDISDIDPSTVANITILKDAAATSIYGVGGANGVIVITTKKVRKHRSQKNNK